MLADYHIRAPFFEFGPKAYLYGKPLLDLVMAIDQYAIEYDVDVIVDPQPTDIRCLHSTSGACMSRADVDFLPPGGHGSILPEAPGVFLRVGVMLNHAECKLTLM